MTEERSQWFSDSAGPFCATCQQCCKTMPGAMSVHDLPQPWEPEVAKLLASGRWALDWWEGDPVPGGTLKRVLYPRPSTQGMEGRVFDGSWGGACTFHSDTGCALPREEMPTECRSLEAKRTMQGRCQGTQGKREVALDWRDHQEELAKIGQIASSKK